MSRARAAGRSEPLRGSCGWLRSNATETAAEGKGKKPPAPELETEEATLIFSARSARAKGIVTRKGRDLRHGERSE
jgi:hypothetical protein